MNKKEIKILKVGTPEITSEMILTYKKYDENETFIQSLKHIRDDLNKMIDNEYDSEKLKLQTDKYVEEREEFLQILRGDSDE